MDYFVITFKDFIASFVIKVATSEGSYITIVVNSLVNSPLDSTLVEQLVNFLH